MAEVRVDPEKVAQLFRSPQGPVVRHSVRLAEQVQAKTKSDTPRSSEPREDSHLADTWVKRFVIRGDRAGTSVYSPHRRALMFIKGTPAHEIRPRRAKVLRFSSHGKVVFARRVNHPGTKPNNVLAKAARALGLRVREM